MTKTRIRVLIDKSCATHPLLSTYDKAKVPFWTQISLTPQKLFGYAAMKLQDASNVKVANYQDVRAKATSYIDIFAHAVTCKSTGIEVNADSEITASLSELIGIGVGLAAICKVFRVNPNRFSRFIGTATGKRMDYVFTNRGRQYLLEVRGTTGLGTRRSMIADVAPKKNSAASKGYAAHAGAITLYSQNSQDDYTTIVDPPTEGGKADKLDELASILEYYHNIYRLTHDAEAFCDYVRSWLVEYRSGRNVGAPKPPTKNQIPRPRCTEDVLGVGIIRGTLYDMRIARRNIARYRTFQEATASIVEPTWFAGTSVHLDEIIASGNWERLIAYLAPGTEDYSDERPNDATLQSGFTIVPWRLHEQETEALRSEFHLLRRRFEQA